VGAIGYVEAGLEIGAAVDAREIDEPDAIFVAAGSGGTAAGLAVGLAALGLVTRVVAVRVTNRIAIHHARLTRLVRETVARLRAVDPRFPDVGALAASRIEIDGGMRGPGYGVGTSEGQRATQLAAEDGVGLDPTYTAKAFAAMLEQADRGLAGKRCMFLSSLSSAPMDEIFGPA
jgi:1-aminocyclopropane-1-carboxylate deaminase/D-cysteine desulfhydrase-like pyridoxal-dependent ACC family enzyme